ncbi:hypothetical protein Ae201684_014535 [Aphanomyces euteiches]|uniref:Uncharacterized protein n=1 Tax=Aphanomyces euteiches TaxID=100861 RepID=A0A6G0WJM6_9STRA|nr:hypothetical protein Ae201684_014535 [Aphanomyces euteiches]
MQPYLLRLTSNASLGFYLHASFQVFKGLAATHATMMVASKTYEVTLHPLDSVSCNGKRILLPTKIELGDTLDFSGMATSFKLELLVTHSVGAALGALNNMKAKESKSIDPAYINDNFVSSQLLDSAKRTNQSFDIDSDDENNDDDTEENPVDKSPEQALESADIIETFTSPRYCHKHGTARVKKTRAGFQYITPTQSQWMHMERTKWKKALQVALVNVQELQQLLTKATQDADSQTPSDWTSDAIKISKDDESWGLFAWLKYGFSKICSWPYAHSKFALILYGLSYLLYQGKANMRSSKAPELI